MISVIECNINDLPLTSCRVTMFATLPLYPLVVPFLLVLFRVLGFFVFVPVFSNSADSRECQGPACRSRSHCASGTWCPTPSDSPRRPHRPVWQCGEMSVGLLIGMLVGAVSRGFKLGAHMISQQMGLSLATIYDPSFEDQSTVIEQVAFWIALVAFLTMGGHRESHQRRRLQLPAVPMGSGGSRRNDAHRGHAAR